MHAGVIEPHGGKDWFSNRSKNFTGQAYEWGRIYTGTERAKDFDGTETSAVEEMRNLSGVCSSCQTRACEPRGHCTSEVQLYYWRGYVWKLPLAAD